MTHKDLALILYRLAEQDRKLDAIHNEAVKTNLRVSKLENGNPSSRAALPFSRFWSSLF
jgi:hypothetical protein